MLNRILNKVFRRLNISALYETSVGIKCVNQLMSSDLIRYFRRGEVFSQPADSLRVCADFLRDEYTQIGKPVNESAHFELVSLLRDGKDIEESEYVRRALRGTLDFRPARRIYSVQNRLTGPNLHEVLRKSFEARLPRVQAGRYEPIKVAELGGAYYVLDGKHTAATCALLGMDVKCVDATPFLFDSFMWWAYQRLLTSRHRHLYTKHIEFFDSLVASESWNDRSRTIRRDYQTIEEVVADLEENPVERTGTLYHPIPFPEFDHLETSSDAGAVTEKWRLIEGVLARYLGRSDDLSGVKVLDIGANAGFYTFTLANRGAEVTAFEPHPRYAAIGRFLARDKGLPVTWHEQSFSPDLVEGVHFDLTLMLSVFQWMARGGARMNEARALLGEISSMSGALVFELGYNRGNSAIRTRKLNHYAELVELLRNHTSYRYFFLLGKTRLWKGSSRYLVFCSNDDRFDDPLFGRIIRGLHV